MNYPAKWSDKFPLCVGFIDLVPAIQGFSAINVKPQKKHPATLIVHLPTWRDLKKNKRDW